MSTLIVISSSPTHAFAPSPTQVNISSPTKGIRRGSQDDSLPVDKLRPASSNRVGFSPGFVTARHVLATRPTAENVPISAHSPPKFAPVGSQDPESQTSPCAKKPRFTAPLAIETDWDEPAANTVIKVLPADARRRKATKYEPLNLATAVARRQQWTPPKIHAEPSKCASLGFGIDLAKNFGNPDTEHVDSAGLSSITCTTSGTAKRRKVDLTGISYPRHDQGSENSMKLAAQPKTARAKSPVKKSKTITALATSTTLTESSDAADPMRQWLSSTQANLNVERDPDTFETRVTCKAGRSKPIKSRSRLKSPNTVRSTLDSQELIFATASQLVRDDSPTFLRDTVEAMKQSEQNCWSSPLRSQQTVNTAGYLDTPPKQAISRFQGRRHLWSVANRDEHEALLYNDDLFDRPEVKTAFAGRDTLLQATGIEDDAHVPESDSLHLLANTDLGLKLASEFDRKSSTTQPLKSSSLQRKAYSTPAKLPASKRTKDRQDLINRVEVVEVQALESLPVTSPIRKKLPAKPNYASWSDEDLKAAVKAHGYNRLRARKSMIDKLDERWAEQYGIDPSIAKAATKKALKNVEEVGSANVLAEVHHTAARPVPKVKRPRKRRASPAKPEKAVSGPDSVQIDEDIVDISEIDTLHTSAFDRLSALQVPDEERGNHYLDNEIAPSTAPVRGTGVQATSIATDNECQFRLTTPPPTLSETYQESSPAFADVTPKIKSPKKPRSNYELPASPPATAKQPDITSSQTDAPLPSRILEAIKHVPSNIGNRNHYKNPTWYEKILLYDPIVIEDFTAWLNTEGFNAINEDREIDANEVKEWCHAKGVTCLWKGGWRGNKKAAKVDE